jgi:hypothetical protein
LSIRIGWLIPVVKVHYRTGGAGGGPWFAARTFWGREAGIFLRPWLRENSSAKTTVKTAMVLAIASENNEKFAMNCANGLL